MTNVIGEITVERSIPNIAAQNALNAAVKTQLGSKVSGIARRKTNVIVLLEQTLTPEEDNAVRQLILNFDMATRTPDQLAIAVRQTDFLEIIDAQAEAALAQLDTGITAIDNDVTAVNAAGNLADMKVIVLRMLAREKLDLQLEKKLVKGIQILKDKIAA